MKSLSTVMTLFDDAGNREKFAAMNMIDVLVDDSRNDNMAFWNALDDFLVWGKTYRLTIEELG